MARNINDPMSRILVYHEDETDHEAYEQLKLVVKLAYPELLAMHDGYPGTEWRDNEKLLDLRQHIPVDLRRMDKAKLVLDKLAQCGYLWEWGDFDDRGEYRHESSAPKNHLLHPMHYVGADFDSKE